VLRPEQTADAALAESIRDFVRAHLAKHEVPREIEFDGAADDHDGKDSSPNAARRGAREERAGMSRLVLIIPSRVNPDK